MYLPWAYIQSELSSILESVEGLKKIIKLIHKQHNTEPVRRLGVVMEEAVRWIGGWKARCKERVVEDLAPGHSVSGNDLTGLVLYLDTLIDAAKEFKKHFLFLLVLKLMVRHEIDLWPEAKKLCYAASMVVGSLCDTVERLAVIQRHLENNRRLQQMGLPAKQQFSWTAFNRHFIEGGVGQIDHTSDDDRPEPEPEIEGDQEADQVESCSQEDPEENRVAKRIDGPMTGPSIGPKRLFGDAGMGREKAALYSASCVAGAEGDSGENVKVLVIERSSYKKVVAMEICRTLQRVSAFEGFPQSQLQEIAMHAVPMSVAFHSYLFSSGDEAKYVYVVERGELRVEAPNKQREAIKTHVADARRKSTEDAKRAVHQQLPESQLEKDCLELELKVDLLAEGAFKEAEKARLVAMQEDVEHIIFMRGADDEEQRIKALKKPPKKPTKSCLESSQKSHFLEPRGLDPVAELALVGPGTLIYEGEREDPYSRKNLRWVHKNDCRCTSNETRVFRILREDYEHGIRKPWTEETNGAPERTEDRGARLHRLDDLREGMKSKRTEQIRQCGGEQGGDTVDNSEVPPAPHLLRMPTPPPEPKFTKNEPGVGDASESKAKRAMAGKESWRRQHGSFVFHQKAEGLDDLLTNPAPPPLAVSQPAPEELESQEGCISYFHNRLSYQSHTSSQLPIHTQKMAQNKARAHIPSYIDYDQVRREIAEDEALGYKSGPSEIQDRIAAVMQARQEEEALEREKRLERASKRPRDEKQLKAIEAEASVAQERLVRDTEEKKRRREQLKPQGGDSEALVHANMPGMSDQRFRNIPTPQLRERLRANGALTARDDRKADGGIQQAWESPVKNYGGKPARFNVSEPRYCRHNTARFWQRNDDESTVGVEMDHFAKGIWAKQKEVADKATAAARESLRFALKYPGEVDKEGKPQWERKIEEKKTPRRRPQPEKQTAQVSTRWTERLEAKNAKKWEARAKAAKRGRTPELALAGLKAQDRAVEEAAGKGGGMMGLFRDCMFPPVRKVQDECFGEDGAMGVRQDARPSWSYKNGAQTHR